MRILILTAALVLAGPAAFAQTTHSHSHSSSETKPDGHADMKGVHAEATVNSIDGSTVNVSHGPIPAIGWPAMTMDLPLLEGAEVGDLKPGDTAMMMLEQGADGLYGVRALMPVK